VEVVEVLVFVPAEQMFGVSAHTICFGLATVVEITPLMGVLFMYFFEKFRV